MESTLDTGLHLGGASKSIARRIMVILENRFQLLMVEAQEEREQVVMAIFLAVGVAAFGLLAGVSVTVVIAVALWEHSPVVALLVLTGIYTLAAVIFYLRLKRLKQDWQTFPGTLDQLKKDRECLEKNLI